MKYLLVGAVVAFVLWLMFGLGRRVKGKPPADLAERAAAPAPPAAPAPAPAVMVACAHCGVHLPQGDALFDVAGRPYCGDSHRLAGPR